MIRDFTADLSDAILDPRVGFNRENTDITKAANDSLRKEFATDILVYLRSTHSKYKELAPELDDDTSLEIVASTVSRVKKVEVELRHLIFDVYVRSFGKSWRAEIPKRVNQAIADWSRDQELTGNEIPKDSVHCLNGTNVTHLWDLLTYHPDFFFSKGGGKGALGHIKSEFDMYFNVEYRRLRNAHAHNTDFPSYETKTRWMSSLTYVEKSILHARKKLAEALAEEE